MQSHYPILIAQRSQCYKAVNRVSTKCLIILPLSNPSDKSQGYGNIDIELNAPSKAETSINTAMQSHYPILIAQRSQCYKAVNRRAMKQLISLSKRSSVSLSIVSLSYTFSPNYLRKKYINPNAIQSNYSNLYTHYYLLTFAPWKTKETYAP
jgi:hypothetical protein